MLAGVPLQNGADLISLSSARDDLAFVLGDGDDRDTFKFELGSVFGCTKCKMNLKCVSISSCTRLF